MTTYKLLDPHPAVIAKWKASHYLPDSVRIPQVESRTLAALGQCIVQALVDPAPDDPTNPRKEELCIQTTEATDRPITRTVHKFYRVQADKQEYLYYVERLAGESYGGVPCDVTRTVGKYFEPQFTKTRNRETGAITITGHADGIAKYDIPWGQEFTDPSTGEKTKLEDLPRAEKCNFYVRSGTGRPFELLGITFEDFTNKPFADLLFYGQNGKWPTTEVEAPAPIPTPTRKGKKEVTPQ